MTCLLFAADLYDCLSLCKARKTFLCSWVTSTPSREPRSPDSEGSYSS
jgi:hypothetical protein